MSHASFKSQYNRDIAMHPQSFISRIHYREKDQVLLITFRATRQEYAFKNVTKNVMNNILRQTGKSSYIASTIINSKAHPSEFVRIVPEHEHVIFTARPAINRWLSR
jgi:hypothetical protein